MVKKAILISILLSACVCAGARNLDTADFQKECDSLSVLLQERTTVRSSVSLLKVTQNGRVISFNFTKNIGDYPWTYESLQWFRDELQNLLPEKYKDKVVGELKCSGRSLSRYITNEPGKDGKACDSPYRVKDHRWDSAPLVTRDDLGTFDKGLSGRHLALWQSHGRYYEQKLGRWEWQRATIFETVEDLYTQSYVVPFLTPMLENAGAVVLLPRERDFSTYEVIADNDSGCRDGGAYSESGSWQDAGAGFRDQKEVYVELDNPFTMGTARQARQEGSSEAKAVWSVNMPERGTYAVYVSYKSLEESTDCARYVVHHLGGETRFTVNQQMGGGMWVFLGYFELPEGKWEVVTLEAATPEGHKSNGKVVTADAVKVGGGMGNIARGSVENNGEGPVVSGMPRFTEGARYWLQWSGFDQSVWNLNEQQHDYRDDFMCRGPWVEHLTGGSRVSPDSLAGKKIPVDLSFAFHTDAGTRQNDTIVGTLAIYTLLKDNSQVYTDGSDRQAAREYTNIVQSQICDDIRALFAPEWRRRQTWDRSYSESRMPNVPAMLLELLSHQNFADMKYGLDPAFRFTVSRSIYKGMLKFLSNRYGCDYLVQPLPVNSFSAVFAEEGKVRLSWKETVDTLEPTARAERYILYTKIDDGGWDNGVVVEPTQGADGVLSYVTELPEGHIYSWKIAAANDGGVSFPSRVMSAGVPSDASARVLVVDNFDRVAGPTFYDSADYAGFDNRQDGGIGWNFDCSYIGDMYEWHRKEPWQDDDCPGFGASYTDYADKIIAGNTFNWSEIHGRMVFEAGYAYCSASSDAFAATPSLADGCGALDLVCGKQVTTQTGTAQYGYRYSVFPDALQDAIKTYAEKGGNLLVSGAYIGTDAWSYVYPIHIDEASALKTQEFCRSTLGYKWRTNYGSHKCTVHSSAGFANNFSAELVTEKNRYIYALESPDGIEPADQNGKVILRYGDSNVAAGVLYEGNGYRCISMGFPLETIGDCDSARQLMQVSLNALLNK